MPTAPNLPGRPLAWLAALLVLLLAQTQTFQRRHSITYDETIYLNLALDTIRERAISPEFPALGVAPLPVLAHYVLPLAWTIDPGEKRPSSQAPRDGDLRLVRVARVVSSVVAGGALVTIIFVWLLRRRGTFAAVLGAGLAVLSPTVVAHASLATTDMTAAVLGLGGAAAIAWWASAPTPARTAACAALIALAMSAKYSLLILLPVAVIVVVREVIRRSGERSRVTIGQALGAVALLAVLVPPFWWAGHLFARGTADAPASAASLAELATVDGVRAFALSTAPVLGLRHQLIHSREGEEAFLTGERSNRGWWYYYPMTFLVKSTPVELLLTVCVAVFLAHGASRGVRRALLSLDTALFTLLCVAVVLWAGVTTSSLDIGHRYILLCYPVLFVAAIDRLTEALGGRPAVLWGTAGLLLAGQLASSLSIAPHYLAYANGLAGGPSRVWTLLADSSLDWGQDLPALREYLDDHVRGPVILSYFGTALPDAYGVRGDDPEHLHHPPEEYAAIAISVTHLHGLHLGQRDPFERFRSLTASAQPGYSIMVYDLSAPRAREALHYALSVMH